MVNVDEMFGAGADVEQKIKEMATFIAVESDAVLQLKKEHINRKANLEALKTDLSSLMQQNGFEKVALDNGLTPKAMIQR